MQHWRDWRNWVAPVPMLGGGVIKVCPQVSGLKCLISADRVFLTILVGLLKL